MSNKTLFIKTTDSKTKDKLIEEGFQLVDSNNGWVFLNRETSSNLNFEELKVVYSNILHV